MPLLQVESLTKQFYINHLERTIPVFAELSFSLEAGEFMLIGGANGAGKSSLLRLVAGLNSTSSGELILEGSDAESTIAEHCHYIGHADAKWHLQRVEREGQSARFRLRIPALGQSSQADLVEF